MYSSWLFCRFFCTSYRICVLFSCLAIDNEQFVVAVALRLWHNNIEIDLRVEKCSKFLCRSIVLIAPLLINYDSECLHSQSIHNTQINWFQFESSIGFGIYIEYRCSHRKLFVTFFIFLSTPYRTTLNSKQLKTIYFYDEIIFVRFTVRKIENQI